MSSRLSRTRVIPISYSSYGPGGSTTRGKELKHTQYRRGMSSGVAPSAMEICHLVKS
jgi:hypothetical protein